MNRFHVHLGVADLDRSIRFYTDLFGNPPVVHKPDYAKWMLDNPRVNFAISQRGGATGVRHLGLQVESADELAALGARFEVADAATTVAEPAANCCYAKSDKHWVRDPQGVVWEAFHSYGEAPDLDGERMAPQTANECCGPASTQSTAACGAAESRATAACCG